MFSGTAFEIVYFSGTGLTAVIFDLAAGFSFELRDS
jgi:hypothetical protein